MILIGKFDEFDVYRLNENNVYILFHETHDLYTIIDEGKLTKVSDHLKSKLLNEIE